LGSKQEAVMLERKHIRLKGYDYSQPGEYFVTICIRGRQHLLGEIADGNMVLNAIGKTAKECWNEIPLHCPNVEIDAFVVMPNHVHGIIRIMDNPRRDVQLNIPTETYHSRISPRAGSLAVIVRTYKAAVTTICRKNGIAEFGWQSGFYEHIIRDDRTLARIRDYIASNPQRWICDVENPNRHEVDGLDQWLRERSDSVETRLHFGGDP
jgi:putative transposase